MATPEFKRDERDGRLKLIECNHRFTMSNELVRRVGINFPLIAYKDTLGLPPDEPNGFREGVYLWSPGQDARAAFDARRRGQITLRAWLRSLLHLQHLTLLDWKDPAPFLAKLWKRLSPRGRATARDRG
jgi:predicted ATP-grasp superfamily ATP-dependent carboligase